MTGQEPCGKCGTTGGRGNPFRVAFVGGVWQYTCIPCSGVPLSPKEAMLLAMSLLTVKEERV
jgi:hypothetical protein